MTVRESLSRQAGSGPFLFVALSLANASNYLFQVISSRHLGPADYSLMGGLFAIVTIIGVSTSALQTASAKLVAEAGRTQPVALRQDPLLRRATGLAALAAVAFAIASPAIATFFRGDLAPVLAIALYVVPAPLLAIGLGRLQGLQSFATFAVISLAMAAGRLLLTTAALAGGLRVTGVMLTTATVAAGGAVWALSSSRGATSTTAAGIWKEAGRATVALVLFWVMVSIDVPVARHTLSAELAGQYTAASVIGKAILWLPGAISLMMFPRVAQARAEGDKTHPLLVRALLPTIAMCIAAVAGLFFLGSTIIPIFFGESYEAGAGLAWKVGLVSVPFAVANLLVFYHLTRATSRFLLALAGAVLLEIGVLAIAHDSIDDIITGLAVGSASVVVGLVVPGTIRRLRDHGVMSGR
jgi:O-antigen/teichoic acid export membrane protein